MVDFRIRYYDRPIQWKRALDIACPEQLSSKTALFYVHGGGWSQGAREQFHHHLEYFSQRGYLCTSAGYRLVPAVAWHEQFADVADGYDQFAALIQESKYEISQVIVIGSSAGAHLASMLALSPDLHSPNLPIAACVSINGPATLEPQQDMNAVIKALIEAAFRTTYEEHPEVFLQASPLQHIGEHAPDFLFLLAGNEMYFPHEASYRMVERLRSYGKRAEAVCIPDAPHGFFYQLTSPEQQLALKYLEQFIQEYNS